MVVSKVGTAQQQMPTLVSDQYEALINLYTRAGHKEAETFMRRVALFWAGQGPAYQAFTEQEFKQLRVNYEWVCAELKEVTSGRS